MIAGVWPTMFEEPDPPDWCDATGVEAVIVEPSPRERGGCHM